MTEHLPECPSESIVCEGEYCLCDYAHFCCCDALRACEQRVLEGRPDPGISEEQAYVNHSIYRNGYEQGKQDCALTHAIRGLQDMNRIAARGYDEGQRDAIDAVREAVEAMDLHGCLPREPLNCNCIGPKVIATIDALREEKQ